MQRNERIIIQRDLTKSILLLFCLFFSLIEASDKIYVFYPLSYRPAEIKKKLTTLIPNLVKHNITGHIGIDDKPLTE